MIEDGGSILNHVDAIEEELYVIFRNYDPPCTMLLLEELGKCPFVGKGSTGEYLVYIVMINLVKLSSC